MTQYIKTAVFYNFNLIFFLNVEIIEHSEDRIFVFSISYFLNKKKLLLNRVNVRENKKIHNATV